MGTAFVASHEMVARLCSFYMTAGQCSCTDYWLLRAITDESKGLIEQYSILDTFDMLSPEYISPQSPDTMRQWFVDAGYDNIEFVEGATFPMRGTKRIT